MRKFLSIFAALALLLSLCACGDRPAESEPEGLQIVTSVFPAYDFARQIAGERANVTLLLPPGAEIHSFEPTARDMIRIRNAALFVYNGGESEAWVEELLESGEEIRSLSMLDCVDALEEEVREGRKTPCASARLSAGRSVRSTRRGRASIGRICTPILPNWRRWIRASARSWRTGAFAP